MFTQRQCYHNSPLFSDNDMRADLFLYYPDVPGGAIAIPEIGRPLLRLFLNFSIREKNFSLIAVFMAKPA